MKELVPLILLTLLTGCVSMDGKMLNAHGEEKDCSASGGGIGLGMVVGAALAATSNQLCESKWEDQGYLVHDNIGNSGIELAKENQSKPLVTSVSSPASNCILVGDTLLSVDNKDVNTAYDAREAIFKESGEELNILLARNTTQKNCLISLE